MKDSKVRLLNVQFTDDLRKAAEKTLQEINVSITERSLSSDIKRSCTKEAHVTDKQKKSGTY